MTNQEKKEVWIQFCEDDSIDYEFPKEDPMKDNLEGLVFFTLNRKRYSIVWNENYGFYENTLEED